MSNFSSEGTERFRAKESDEALASLSLEVYVYVCVVVLVCVLGVKGRVVRRGTS